MTDILTALAARYCAPEWALFFEVANGPGSTLRRYADAVAMSLFPSRGLHLHGFEVKTARADWLHEKKNPEKADEIGRYCDFWWLATTEGVALLDEIPDTWGWLVLQKSRLVQKKAPTKMSPQEIDRRFLAALLRRKDESMLKCPEVKAKLEALRAENEKNTGEAIDRAVRGERREKEDLQHKILLLEKALGTTITDWNAEDIGQAVKLVMNAAILQKTIGQMLDPMESYWRRCESAAENAKRDIEALRTLLSSLPPPYTKEGKPVDGHGLDGLARWGPVVDANTEKKVIL